jgi:hypothetical protein
MNKAKQMCKLVMWRRNEHEGTDERSAARKARDKGLATRGAVPIVCWLTLCEGAWKPLAMPPWYWRDWLTSVGRRGIPLWKSDEVQWSVA